MFPTKKRSHRQPNENNFWWFGILCVWLHQCEELWHVNIVCITII